MVGQTFTPDEVAKLFKISKNTVYELVKRGELKAFKVGNKMRIEESEVDRYKSQAATKGNHNSEAHFSIKLSGSHDFIIEYLIQYLAKEANLLSVHPTYIGSLEGLMMLYRGHSDVATIHLLDPVSGEYNIPFIKQLFVHEPITVMRLASRKQGFIVPKGNPKKIMGFEDLLRKDVTFVNRQKGAGTRFLLDYFLAKYELQPSLITGYHNEEWNHLGSASHISSGQADVTFGIQSAASKLDLDFIPITSEQFDLVFRWNSTNSHAIQHLIDMIQLTTFKEHLSHLEGYDCRDLGIIIYQN